MKKIRERWRKCWSMAAPPESPNFGATPQNVYSGRTLPLETRAGNHVPAPGMPGKNVQWVPCSPVVLDKMLDMAHIVPDDYVIDPGSGDGRIVIGGAKRGARSLGIESNPKLVTLSRHNAEKEGVQDQAVFSEGDFFDADFSGATVITLFLRKDLNIKLQPKLLDLKPGTRVVSNIFDMGDWNADEITKVEDPGYYFKNHTVRLWIVPAKVEGTWKLPDGELEISQAFQMIRGTYRSGSRTIPLEGKMTGSRIRFTVGDQRFSGHATGRRMILDEGWENRLEAKKTTLFDQRNTP